MSEIKDEDVTASVLAYGKASSSGCRDKWLSLAGMRAAAREIERRVLERVKAETRPMHEPVSDKELTAMIDVIHYGKADSWFERVRSAGNALLASRAAAPRGEVVVTEEMRQECMKAIGWEDSGCKRAIWEAMTWLADRLNGKRAAPVDPRVGIVGEWLAGGFSTGEGTDADIRDLLAKLDEVKS